LIGQIIFSGVGVKGELEEICDEDDVSTASNTIVVSQLILQNKNLKYVIPKRNLILKESRLFE